jgi:N-acetylmuramoyl-L-alanine amidase
MGVRYLSSQGIVPRLPAGWQVVVLMLIAALTWPAMPWAAAKSPRTMGGKPQPNVKAAHRGEAATATPLCVVREIRHWSNPTYTRIVIDIGGEARYRAGRLQNPDRLYLDLFGAQLAPKLQGRPIEVIDHIVSSVRAAQYQRDVVRVVMDIHSLRDYHVFAINNPYRLVIDVMGATGDTLVQAPPPAPVPRQAAIEPERSRLRPEPLITSKRLSSARESRWHVVIDAGHGGKDPGAIGASGLIEKDVVLDIAKRLRDLMQQEPQWRVTLTRDSDVFIPLEERPAIANAKGADLFVSIHANAAERSDVYGIETYFLDLASDEQSMRLAARENATPLSKVSDLQHILRDLSMTSKGNESSLLAGSVQQALVQAPGAGKNGRDLGVKHAPFLVLMGAEMPAILVETGFISHPGEERKLADSKYRAQAARAIFEGIRDYLVTTNGSLARQVQR